MSLGRLFQTFVAAEDNVLAPSVVGILPCGTSNLSQKSVKGNQSRLYT